MTAQETAHVQEEQIKPEERGEGGGEMERGLEGGEEKIGEGGGEEEMGEGGGEEERGDVGGEEDTGERGEEEGRGDGGQDPKQEDGGGVGVVEGGQESKKTPETVVELDVVTKTGDTSEEHAGESAEAGVEGETGGPGKEGSEGSPRDKEERKVYKSQLLKSAGIQLQPSSESDGGSAVTDTSQQVTGDRSLEQFSEILLDSDLSHSDSEVQGEEVVSGRVEEGGEEGKSKSERRVRFADEVTESTDDPNTGWLHTVVSV